MRWVFAALDPTYGSPAPSSGGVHGQAHHQPDQKPVLRRRPVDRRAQAARHQQGHRRRHHQGAEPRRGGDAIGHRGRQPRAAGLVQAARQGALQDRAPMVRPDGRARRRAGAAVDQRAGQAAGRGQGRDPLCRRLRGVLRRGGQARPRRDHPDIQGGRPHRRHQAAGRRGRRHHAVELPRRHDHAQGGPGAWPWAARWCASRPPRRR